MKSVAILAVLALCGYMVFTPSPTLTKPENTLPSITTRPQSDPQTHAVKLRKELRAAKEEEKKAHEAVAMAEMNIKILEDAVACMAKKPQSDTLDETLCEMSKLNYEMM